MQETRDIHPSYIYIYCDNQLLIIVSVHNPIHCIDQKNSEFTILVLKHRDHGTQRYFCCTFSTKVILVHNIEYFMIIQESEKINHNEGHKGIGFK